MESAEMEKVMAKKTTESKLVDFGEKVFRKVGMSAADAHIAASVLSRNELRGVYSHGTTFYHGYSHLCLHGGADAEAVFETNQIGNIIFCNANRGVGVVSAYKGMRSAIAAARETGIGLAFVHGSTHAAAMGYYAMMAAEEGMFGMAMSNGDPVMAVPGAKGKVIGNNPFAYAAPYQGEDYILFDIAMSAIAGAKVKSFEVEGKKLPKGWLIDQDGNATEDPVMLRKGGSLLPFSMHKGYGFAIMVEILAGVLSGAGIIRDNVDWMQNPAFHNDIGQFLFALDIEHFMPMEKFRERMLKMGVDLKSAECVGEAAILLPGEIEMKAQREQEARGISLNQMVYENLKRAAESTGLGLELEQLFE